MKEFIPGYFVTEDGKVFSQRSGKWLKPQKHKAGYSLYCMPKGDKFGWYLAHRLVALCFIDNPDNLPLVCHKDDDPTNNHKDNLYWGTKSTNLVDAYANGKKKFSQEQQHKMTEARWPK